MAKYIDSEKLIAEIKKRLVKYDTDYTSAGIELKELLSFINSIQQEQPEVDLEKEIDRFWDSCIKHKNERGGNVIWSSKLEIEVLASHFYELGVNAKKEK